METDGSFKVGARVLGLRLSVEECTLIGGVTPKTDVVDVPNPLEPVDVVRFGVGVKVWAKGLSDFEVDVSEPKTSLLAAPKVDPLTWRGCGGSNAAVCDDCSASSVDTVDGALAGVGTKGGKDETDEDVEKPRGALKAANTCI